MKPKKKTKALWIRTRGGIKPRTKITLTKAKGEKLWRKLWPKIKKVSAERAKLNRQYLKARREFLIEHPVCWCSSLHDLKTGKLICWSIHRATDVHHSRGRAGSLLTDKRFFIAVCRAAHVWIENNLAQARSLGLLCAEGQWNKPVKEAA